MIAEPHQTSSWISRVVPNDVIGVETKHGGDAAAILFPEEVEALGVVAEQRRREFTAGRNCAHAAVLRQNSIRTENSAIPCRDGCPIQVIPSPSVAKNLSRGTPSGTPVYIRMEEPGRFHGATSVRIR
jgi:hypothetical protein